MQLCSVASYQVARYIGSEIIESARTRIPESLEQDTYEVGGSSL